MGNRSRGFDIPNGDIGSKRRSLLKLSVIISVFCLPFLLGGTKVQAGDFVEVSYDFTRPEITKSGDYHSVNIVGLDRFGKPGLPVLPYRTAKILIPFDSEVSDVEISCAEKVTLPGSYMIEPGEQPVPFSFEGPVEPTPPDELVYQSSTPFPEKTYSDWSLQCKHGYRFIMLNLHPVEYLPVLGRISYYPRITARIYTTAVARTSPSDYLPHRPRPSAQEIKIIKGIVDNPEAVNTYPSMRQDSGTLFDNGASPLLDPEDYEYVIITNEALANASGAYTFQDLVAHKIPRGTSATIVTTEWIYANYDGTRPDGSVDNQTRIRNFIIDAYNNWETTYVLLGGDGDGADVGGESGDSIIPARGFTGNGLEGETNIPADMYYACLDGSFDYDGDGVYGEPTDGPSGGEVDLYAEVYVGRAPVDSEEEVSNFVQKTIAYENTYSQDPSLKKALMLGEDLGWSVWGCDYKEEVRDGSCNHGYCTVGFPVDWDITTLCDRDDLWNKNDLIPLLNSGTHLLNHLGHANVGNVMNLGNSDVDGLTNSQYFLAYTQGCYCGSFDNRTTSSGSYTNYDCIAEHFVTEASGAFAVIMNSRYGWGYTTSTNGAGQHFDREFFDAYFGEEITNLGIINQDSKEDNAGFVSSSLYGRWSCYTINLFGDPQTPIGGLSGPAGMVILDRAVYPASGDVNIQVLDSDLNVNSGAIDEYSNIIVVATTGGDQESSITMTETGADTGVFVGTISISASPVSQEDEELEITCSISDIITVTYYDANDGTGNPATPTDTADTDCFAPLISNVQVTDIDYFGTTITWDTDEAADSCVYYGTSLPLDLSECKTSLVTGHTVYLAGLVQDTTYYFEVASTDEAGNQAIDDNSGSYYQFHSFAPQIYSVPGDYTTIQAAVNDVSDGNVIIVGAGTYDENINLLGKEITIRSESGAASTKIDGGGSGTVFNLAGAEARLEGLTITNGSASNGGGIYCDNSSPTIVNCVIINNRATQYGGGIYCDSGSFPTISNCTISGNTANSHGGGICSRSGSSPTVVNTILWANSPNEIRLLFGGSIDITYSDIEGGWTGTGNMDCDPEFLGFCDYHLRPSSCCIDAGTSNNAPDHDFDGDSRPQGGGYDIGADEYIEHTGFIALDKEIYPLDATVNIVVMVMDSDLNTDSDVSEQYSDIITITTTGGDEETTVAMTETGPDTGLFTGAIPSATTVVIQGDGELQIDCQITDMITCTYSDANDGTGPATPTDTAGTDCLPPEITNVQVSNSGSISATITWDTDEASDSCVYYGTDFNTDLTECDSSLVTNHMIDLTGLTPDTIYYFAVSSTDEAGNQTVDDNSGQYYQFQTLAMPSQWAMTYGGNASDWAAATQWTSDGGCIVAGETSSFGVGGSDFWILRLNAYGNIDWQKTYGRLYGDSADSIDQTFDEFEQPDGYIVAGSTLDSDDTDAECDLWILKLDLDGAVIWQKTYDRSLCEYSARIQQTTDGGYIVACRTYTVSYNYDIWILKLDSEGNIEWEKTYGGTESQAPSSIQQTTDGGYIVAAGTSSFGAGNYDIWILKLDSEGNVDWQKTYGGTGGDYARSIQETTDGGYVVGGSTWSFGGWEFWVLKLDSEGNVDWQKTYGPCSTQGTAHIRQTTDGSYIVAGRTDSFGAGGSDVWVLKLNSAGNIIWQNTYGGSLWDYISSVSETTDNSYVVAGHTESYGAGSYDFWLFKLDANGEIPNCGAMGESSAVVSNTFVSGQSTGAVPQTSSAVVVDTQVTPLDTNAEISVVCDGAFLYEVSGRIVDDSQAGVDGTTVELAGSATDSTVTSGGGYYSFTVKDGAYTVTPSQEGYEFVPLSRGVTVDGANVPDQNFTATRTYSLILGRVTDGSEIGIDGIGVELTGSNTNSTVTSGGGYYSFLVPDGNYTVTPGAEGYEFAPPKRDVTVAGGADVPDQDFTAITIYSWISGRITDNGQIGIDGITVELAGARSDSTVTSGGGYYSFLVPDGSYTVTPDEEGEEFTPASRNVTVVGTDVPDQDFTASGAYTYVPDNYPTIQGAINAVSEGTNIIVRFGTYTENIDYMGKGITVRSESGPEVTTIDAAGTGRVVTFESGEGASSLLKGFTITNGSVTPGAGVFCDNNSSPKFIDCVITGNDNVTGGGGSGGGIFCRYDSSPTFVDCTISWNRAGSGAAMYLYHYSSPTFTNCMITGNLSTTGDGAGVVCRWYASPTFTDCTIVENTSGDDGGGIYCMDSSSPTFANCIISNNTAASCGGGIYIGGRASYPCSPTMTNCTVSGNSAVYSGGGIYASSSSLLTMTNCIIINNTAGEFGGGMYSRSDSELTITNCTISGNSAGSNGGGVYVSLNSSQSVVNSIFWNNTAAGTPSQIYVDGGSIDITYSDIEAGWTGTGNIDANPLFADSANDDYHLQSTSPCIDVGNNAAPGLPANDFEGDPRIFDGDGDDTATVDMGADEFVSVQADFSGNPASGTKPLLVQFTDQSTGSITTWSWDFGDGGTSTEQSPSYEYTDAGDYTVSLTVTGPGGGDTETKVGYIHVDEPAAPVADFSADVTSGSKPLTVKFTDQSVGSITSWFWEFGDGETSSDQNPSHTYTNGGDFTVSLTITGPGGSDDDVKADYIHVTDSICECNLVPDNTTVSRGGTLGFQASVTNNTSGRGMVLFGTKVTKPDASQSGFIWGPLQVYLNPGQTKSGHKTHTIPSGFELGTYTYHGYVGRYGNIYDECQFDFEVVP